MMKLGMIGMLMATFSWQAGAAHATGECEDEAQAASDRLETVNDCLSSFEYCSGEDDLTCIEAIDQWESAVGDTRACREDACDDGALEAHEAAEPAEGCDLLAIYIGILASGEPDEISLDCREWLDQRESLQMDLDLCLMDAMGTETMEWNHDCTGYELVPPATFGCTDPIAQNYDPDASMDDGTCVYEVEQLEETAIDADDTTTDDTAMEDISTDDTTAYDDYAYDDYAYDDYEYDDYAYDDYTYP